MSNVTTINEVLLQGPIVSKFSTDEVTILTLTIGNSVTQSKNFPRIVFFNDVKTEADKYEKGDFVRVYGNIQSSKRNPKIQNQVLVTIFAEAIEPAKSIMEETFNVKGNFVDPKNEIRVAGEVTDIEIHTSNICNIVVKTTKNGRISFVRFSRYIKAPNDSALSIAPKDYVYILGHVQTSRKSINGKTVYFQNYVISELNKLK